MKDYCKILNEIIEAYYDNEYPEYFQDDVYNIFEREGITEEYKAEPIKHGRWIDGWICSNCKEAFRTNGESWNYCPNCGARMDEVEE